MERETSASPWGSSARLLSAFSVFAFFFALGYSRGVLSLHVKGITASDVLVGIVAAAQPSGELITRWISPPLLYKYGSKAIMIVCCVALAIVSSGYRLTNAIPIVFLLTLLFGASVGGFGTSAATQILGDSNTEKTRAIALSMYAMARITAQIGAPAVGLGLAAKYPTGNVLSWAAIAAVLGIVPLLFVKSGRSKSGDESNMRKVFLTAKKALRDKVLVGSVIGYFAWSLMAGGMTSFLPLMGREHGFTSIGIFFSASGIMNLLGNISLSTILKKYSSNAVVSLSGVFVSIGIIMAVLARNVYVLALAGAVYGLGTFPVYPCLAASACSRLPLSSGVAIVMFMSGMDIGQSTGSILAGIVAKSFGYNAVFFLAVAIYILGLATYGYLRKKGQSDPLVQ